MSMIEAAMEIDVPAAVLFETLTGFEHLPALLPGVDTVRQIDDRTLYWVGHVLGVRIPWLIEITDMVEDRSISWMSRSGPSLNGTISLEPIGYAGTRVTVLLQHHPASLAQEMTDHLGILRRWAERSLWRVKTTSEAAYGARERLPVADEMVGH
ncbi:SRPBCC family protein [bacterium]|nr:SRPBCC family protein [bacterium]